MNNTEIDPWLAPEPTYPYLVLIYDGDVLKIARLVMNPEEGKLFEQDYKALGKINLRCWTRNLRGIIDDCEEGFLLTLCKKQGASASFKKEPKSANFYPKGSLEWKAWNRGWECKREQWPLPEPATEPPLD